MLGFDDHLHLHERLAWLSKRLSTGFFTSLVGHRIFFSLSGPAEGKARHQHGWLWQLLPLPWPTVPDVTPWADTVTQAFLLEIVYLQHFHTTESWVFYCEDDQNREKSSVTQPLGSQSMTPWPAPSQLTDAHTINPHPVVFLAQPRCGWKQGQGCIRSPIPQIAASPPPQWGMNAGSIAAHPCLF